MGVFAEGNETDPNNVNNTTQDAGETSDNPKENDQTQDESEEKTDPEEEESDTEDVTEETDPEEELPSETKEDDEDSAMDTVSEDETDGKSFIYEGKNYKVTIGTGEDRQRGDEEDTVIQVMEPDSKAIFFICVNETDEYGNSMGPASDAVNDMVLADLKVSKGEASYLNIADPEGTTYSYCYWDEEAQEDAEKQVRTYLYTVSINETPEYGTESEDLTISFKTDDTDHQFPFTIRFDYTQSDSFNVVMEGGEYVIEGSGEELNDILASKDNLSAFYQEKSSRQLTNETYITFLFEPGEVYSGTISVSCYPSEEDEYKINFDMDESNYHEYAMEANAKKQFAKDSNNAVIHGNMIINGGYVDIMHVNFVNDDSYDTAITRKGSTGSFSIWESMISGYPTGIDTDLVSSIAGFLFENNGTGLLFKPVNSAEFTCNSSFFAGNEIAIDLEGMPADFGPEGLCFYGNETDYVVGEEVKGVLFTKENFFAKEYSKGYINDNVTSASVTYKGQGAQLVTSPCVRYPENGQFNLGIDTSDEVISKFIVESFYSYEIDYALDISDLANMGQEFTVGLYFVDEGREIADMVFPAGLKTENRLFGIGFGYEEAENTRLNLYKTSENDLIDEVHPEIRLNEFSRGNVYFEDYINQIDTRTIDGKLAFTADRSGFYIIRTVSEYDYVGPSEDGNRHSTVVQTYILNSGKELQFVYKKLGASVDDAYEDFLANGSEMWIDRDDSIGFTIEDDPSLYQSKDGCLILVFHDRFLNSLMTGPHLLSVKFSDGYAEASLNVEMPVIPKPGEAVKAAQRVPELLKYKLPLTGN